MSSYNNNNNNNNALELGPGELVRIESGARICIQMTHFGRAGQLKSILSGGGSKWAEQTTNLI